MKLPALRFSRCYIEEFLTADHHEPSRIREEIMQAITSKLDNKIIMRNGKAIPIAQRKMREFTALYERISQKRV